MLVSASIILGLSSASMAATESQFCPSSSSSRSLSLFVGSPATSSPSACSAGQTRAVTAPARAGAWNSRPDRSGATTPTFNARSGPIAGVLGASEPAFVVSRSMMSRRQTLPLSSASRQTAKALKVSGLSQSPASMTPRPASIRLAMATSPARESSSTELISRRYMRTGSSVRSAASFVSALTETDACWSSTSS